MQSQFGTSPLASIARVEDGTDTFAVGASVIARADDSRLQSLSDTAGRKVTFAVKGSEFTALPWLVYEEIMRHGVDIFTDAAEVTLADSTDAILQSLQSGRVDAAILRSDVIAHSEERGLLNATSFKFVDAVMTPGYPYPVSTTLLPADVFIAAATVPSYTKKTIAEALFRITKDDYPAQAGSYSTWVPPDSYARMWSLLHDHGLMQSDGTCNPAADLYDIIICPPSTIKASQDTMPSHCREQGIPACPEGYNCYCQPCVPAPPQQARVTANAGISVAALTIIMVVALVVLAAIGVMAYKLQHEFKMPSGLQLIRYKDLGLTCYSKILGQGRHGLVLQAEHSSMSTAVKLLLAPLQATAPAPFCIRSAPLRGWSISSEEALPPSPRSSRGRLWCEGTKTDLHPEGVHQLALCRSSSLLRCPTSIWLLVTAAFMQAVRAPAYIVSIVNGSRWKQLRRRQKALVKVALSTRVHHPNVVPVLGVAECPETKDLLLVSQHFFGGGVMEVVHNLTLELDLEMVISILKDVVSAMAYVHQLGPCIAHQPLSSSKVLLDSNCGAHLQLDYERSNDDPDRRAQYLQPPEALNGCKLDMKTNVYAFGMLIYELLLRKEPYQDEDQAELWLTLAGKRLLAVRRPPFEARDVQDFPPSLVQLMQRCWHQNPTERPTFNDIKTELAKIASETFNCSPERALQTRSSKQQALLNQMLPSKVLAALREGRTPDPEPYDCVTVIFCDLVDYNLLSAALQPHQVVELLDRLYQVLDNLAIRHNLFKVETIGCTHMVVGNLQAAQPEHASKAAWFALDAHKAARTILISAEDPPLGHIALKIGMHSGPVVASVVGTSNPRYCLFGDTVNTASRMQSSCLSNRTQMSRQSAQLAMKFDSRLRYHIKARPGMQNLKGKGPTKTFWLERIPDAYLGKCGDLPERDSLDSNDSSGAGTPVFHRRGSLFTPSSRVRQDDPFPPSKEIRFAEREGSDDGTRPHSSIDIMGLKEAQALKHRSQSMGAIAALSGASKKAKLRALGLVIDSTVPE
ncbi:hypothetical protein ABBQ32_012304 [Trebouxia sp. C0010 RCD-2024]